MENGFPRQAASRAYYAAFYAARATLEAAGIDPPKTHSGLRSRFGELARSSPSLGSELGRALSQLGTGRADADYGEPAMTADDANEAISKAEHLINTVEHALERGLMPPEKEDE